MLSFSRKEPQAGAEFAKAFSLHTFASSLRILWLGDAIYAHTEKNGGELTHDDY